MKILCIMMALASGLVAFSASAQQTSSAVPPTGEAESTRRVPDTLMFSVTELTDIRDRADARQNAVNGSRQGPSPDSIEAASLYLSTIVYYGPRDWTIWINDKPISAGTEFEAFEITSISPESVELLVPLSAQGMRPVKLAPNQSFIVKTGMVVEGPWK